MRALLTCLMLLLLALAAGWRACGGTEAPPTPAPADAPQPAAAPGEGTVLPATGIPAAAPGAGREVVESDRGPARLLVQVQAGVDGPRLPHRDVAVVLVASRDGESLATARTGPDGCCQFVLPLADTAVLRVQSGPGTAQTVQVAPGATLEVCLQVAVRAWAVGRVVDGGGRGIADADLQLEPWSDPVQRTVCWRLGTSDAQGRFRVPIQLGGLLGAVHPDFAPSPRVVVLPGEAAAEPPVRTFELTLLAAPARVRVLAVDARRRPVPAAAVWCTVDAAAGTPGVAPTTGTTDATGTCVLGPLVPGPVRCTVRAAGFGEASCTLPVRAGATAPVEVVLPDAAAVQGRVTAADGTPQPGVWVTAAAPTGVDALRVPSGADGTYHLAGLPAGTVRLSVYRPGTARAAASTELQLAAGATAAWHPVLGEAVGGPQLQGRLADSRGQPLVGWRIVARLASGERRQTTTDGASRFAIALDSPAALDLLAYAPGSGARRFAALHQRIAAPLDGPVDLRLPAPGGAGSLAARLTDVGGVPQPVGWQCWHQERREFAQGQADAQGRFLLADVPAGTVDVQFALPGFANLSCRDLRLAPGQQLDLGDLVLALGGGLHGTVAGPDGNAPAELTITLLQGRETRAVAYAGGSYRIADVPAGEHLLQVQGPDVAGAVFRIAVTAGIDREHPIQLLAGLRRPVWVRGPAAAGATVTLSVRRADEPPQWLQSAALADGLARFEACLQPGTYRLQAWTAAGYRAEGEVVIRAGLDAPHELLLQPR